MPERVVQLTDPRALRAVAHPTRLKLLGDAAPGRAVDRDAGRGADRREPRRLFIPPALASPNGGWSRKRAADGAGSGRGGRPRYGHEWAARGPSGEVDEAGDLLTRVGVERWFEESCDWVERRREETAEWSEAAVFGDKTDRRRPPAELEDMNRQRRQRCSRLT